MDFRERNPTLNLWPEWSLDRMQWNFPYCCISRGILFELVGPDETTHFLLHTEKLPGDEVSFRGYAIEAPLFCPMRQKFERGTMPWTKFWSHRDWVIELPLVLFSEGPVKATYVPFKEVNTDFLLKLKELDSRGGPYKIYHDNLVDLCEFETNYRPGETEHIDRYQDFVLKYRGFLDETCKIRTEFLEFDIPMKKIA